ncbi:hypothetical protein Taro_003889 [Colocasia esculenta]|uniref:Uncharacterized protein n=1 Tax=Colocasia esculenta TaxID=4460 RepID=A0A843TQ50_COLES|nr:hypothetical protein [Colocasia esculenta]
MPSAVTTAASSPRCTAFFSLRGSPGERRAAGQTLPGCGRVDRVASWVGNGVAAAFFLSLERCSCINIATHDDGEDAKDLPLIRDDGNAAGRAWGTATGPSRRRSGKGRKKGFLFEDVNNDE